MKRTVRKLAASLLAAAFLAVGVLPAAAGATGDAGLILPPTGSGLTITAGSNGTLVEADEQLASITLENNTEDTVTIHVVTLGEESDLSIAPGESGQVSAPGLYAEDGDAYKLSLTGSDGETVTEYPITEGSTLSTDSEYTVTLLKGVLDYYVSHGQETARWISCFIYADESGVDPEHSILAGVSGSVMAGDTELSDITIRSECDDTAAIRVGGSGELTVTGADISLIGDGGDDFTGIGSALGAADTATLNVSDSNVYTQGIIRSAIFAGDQGTLNLENVTVECQPGEYQADVSIDTAGMASPPNGLGVWGNCRAMNMVDEATVNITNSTIISQNWGALGVDDITDGHLTVKESTIIIDEQGYGAYAIGKCVDTFENCTFEVNYGVIAYAASGDGAEVILNGGTIANSNGYYGVVTHQSFNGTNSKITVTGPGTQLNAKLGGIIAKGRGADIEISDGGAVNAESGVLIRAQINDDTGAGTMDGTEVVNVAISDTDLYGDIIQGMGAEYEAEETAEAAEAGEAGEAGEAAPDAAAGNPAEQGEANPAEMGEMGDMGGEGMGPGGPGDGGEGMGPGGPGGGGMGGSSAKTESVMNVTVDNAWIYGAISSAVLTPAIDDGNISMDNIEDVGVITETSLEYNPWATLNVTLQNGAGWIPDKDCYLMSLTLDDTATLAPQIGYLLTMTVDGEEVEPVAGTYEGEIVLTITEDPDFVEPVAAEEDSAAETLEAEGSAAETLISPADEAEPEATEEDTPAEAVAEPATGTGNRITTAGIAGIAAAVVVVLGAGTALVVKKKKK